jgi:hypothetical protein
MLTRDIELQDAILDFLDNCVDGILRSGQAKTHSATPYKGFTASITMAKNYCEIVDSCGGIPFEVAKKYAFAIATSCSPQKAPSIAFMKPFGFESLRSRFHPCGSVR